MDSQLTVVIALMAAAAFGSGFSLRVSDPLLPQVAADFASSVGAAAAIVPAYAIPYGFTQAFSGLLGDRIGKCQAVALSCALSCVLVLLCAFAQSLPQLTIARFICAPAAAVVVPLGMAYVGDVVPYERRQPILARFLAGQMMGMIVGQIAGGIIGDYFGWRSVFIVLALVFAVAGAALASQFGRNPFTKPIRREPGSGTGLLADWRSLMGTPWPRFIIVAVFLEGAIFFGAFTYIAADLHARFGLSYSVVGVIVAAYGVGAVLYASTVQALIGRLGELGLVIGGGVIVLLAYVTLAGEPVWLSAPLAVAALGFGYYMIHNTLQTNATQMMPEARGNAVAAFSSTLFVGQSAGVTLAAPVVNQAGAIPVFVFSAAAWMVLALWICRRIARHKSSRP
jgi:predicted MFS family arabinose efflux permease